MNITISVPKISDVPTMILWGKGNRELWASDREGWYPKESLVKWIRKPERDIILIAKDGAVPVGMCLIHGMRDWAYCSSLFVVKEYRKKGIGKALLAKAEKALKENGCGQLALLVENDNEETQGFYRKQGFQKGFHFVWMDKRLK